ncbi:MAG: hypothetical protein NZM29_00960, partial [Nitrospira sp.]|nr:hypothetical protein [Nitrospira sp.]
WLVTWAPYFRSYLDEQNTVGVLAAAVIDQGGSLGDEVFAILHQSLSGTHEIGGMGRHVARGLLSASRPDGWELMEKMLLAAQRQEGLRQVIIETIDEAHPTAFRRMLRLIKDHNLFRFSSVVRGINVWLGHSWESSNSAAIRRVLEKTLTMLDDTKARQQALRGNDPESAYLALWATAFEDAPASVPPAVKLLRRDAVEFRWIATLHLRQVQLPEAKPGLIRMIDDPDLRVGLTAAIGTAWGSSDELGESIAELEESIPEKPDANDKLASALERMMSRLPKKPTSLPSLVWPWASITFRNDVVAERLLQALDDRSLSRFVPYMSVVSPSHRCHVIRRFQQQKKWDPAIRSAIIASVGDKSADVRKAAREALTGVPLAPGELEKLEALLTRKVGDLRTGVLELLAVQSDEIVFASIERLLASSDKMQRTAGLELLRNMAEANRQSDRCRSLAEAFRSCQRSLTKIEMDHLDAIASSNSLKLTLENGLGVYNPAERTPLVPPQRRSRPLITDAAIACLKSLDSLIHEHRETPISLSDSDRPADQRLLGTIQHGFPWPRSADLRARDLRRLPLRELWEAWFQQRPRSLRDDDGLEIIRARCWLSLSSSWHWQKLMEFSRKSKEHQQLVNTITGQRRPLNLRYEAVIEDLVKMVTIVRSRTRHRGLPPRCFGNCPCSYTQVGISATQGT